MENKVQVELALNSDRFDAAMRNNVYSMNLFTNAVGRAHSALKKLEEPIKISIKEDILIIQKTLKTVMDDTNKDIDDIVKKVTKINDTINNIKTNVKITLKANTDSRKNDDSSRPRTNDEKSSQSSKNSEKKEVKKDEPKKDFLTSLSEKLKKLEEILNKIKESYEKIKSVVDFVKDLFGGKKEKGSSPKANAPKTLKKGSASNSKEKNVIKCTCKCSKPSQGGKASKANAIRCTCTCKNTSQNKKSSGKGKERTSQRRSSSTGNKKNVATKNVSSRGYSSGRFKEAPTSNRKAVTRKGSTSNGILEGRNAKSTASKGTGVLKPKAKSTGASGKAGGNFDFSSITKGAKQSEGALSNLSKIGGKSFGALGKAFGVFKLAFKAIPIIGQILTIIDIIQTLKSAWDSDFMGIKTITLKVWDWIKTKISSIMDVFEKVKTGCSNFINKIGEMWGKVKEFFKNPIKGVVDFFSSGSSEGKPRAFGQRVIPYDNFPILAHQGESLLTASETRRLGSGSVVIPKLADTLVVREEADIDRITSALVNRLDKVRFNMA